MNRILKAFRYSFEGLASAARSEPAFRQELAVFAVAFPVALLLPFGLATKALLVSSLFLVLIAELANTAIEAVVDRISEERHPLSKKAKDIGSALVLLAILNAAAVWSFVLIKIF
ncbi:MAG: diacylglycerol kinase [Rickettsiales bacterium]|jgi:diacylglycerol kinase (ATP)|nr:diacylglycerol kinase [Rickettsiales bacterium]